MLLAFIEVVAGKMFQKKKKEFGNNTQL